MRLLSIAAICLAGLLCLIFSGQQALAEPLREASAPLTASPPAVRGTMIMLHGGGWMGPGPTSQKKLMTMPGKTFLEHGWGSLLACASPI